MRSWHWLSLALSQGISGRNDVLDLVREIREYLRTSSIKQLTCRPFPSLLASQSRSPGVQTVPRLVRATFFKNWLHTVFLVSNPRAVYDNATEILLWNASSISLIRFVVRNMIPRKYSSLRKKTETMAFCTLLIERACTNTSASSRRTIAFQWWTRRKMRDRCSSRGFGSWPSSPADIWKSQDGQRGAERLRLLRRVAS